MKGAKMRPNASGRGWFAAAAALTAAGVLALIWALAEGESLANAIDDLPLLLLASAVGAALYGWRQTLENTDADQQRALEERAKAEALAKSLETHRRWVAELRRQISSIEHEHGVLGSTNDVPAFLVKTAMAFVGAKKGLLLSRKDEDSDGALDLLASQGFQHDPEHSGVAQRFAREVIARDETVRRRARPCRRSRARQTARSRTCSRSRSTSATGSAAWSCSRTSPNREKGYAAGDEAVKKVGRAVQRAALGARGSQRGSQAGASRS